MLVRVRHPRTTHRPCPAHAFVLRCGTLLSRRAGAHEQHKVAVRYTLCPSGLRPAPRLAAMAANRKRDRVLAAQRGPLRAVDGRQVAAAAAALGKSSRQATNIVGAFGASGLLQRQPSMLERRRYVSRLGRYLNLAGAHWRHAGCVTLQERGNGWYPRAQQQPTTSVHVDAC